MTSGIGGSQNRDPINLGKVDNVSLSPVDYLKACKKADMPTHEAVGKFIKFIFSGREARKDQVAQLPGKQNAQVGQVASNPAPAIQTKNEFTLSNCLDDNEWLNVCYDESKRHSNEGGTATNVKEAVEYVMNELKSNFSDYEISDLSPLPDRTLDRGGGIYVGVQISPKDDPYGEKRCIYVKMEAPDGGVIHNVRKDFLQELNRLNK